MGRAKQTVTKTKSRVKKNGKSSKSSYEPCRICHGTGLQPTPKRKNK